MCRQLVGFAIVIVMVAAAFFACGGGGGSGSPENIGRAVVEALAIDDVATLQRLVRPDGPDWARLNQLNPNRKLTGCTVERALAEREGIGSFRVIVTLKEPCGSDYGQPVSIVVVGVHAIGGRMYWDGAWYSE